MTRVEPRRALSPPPGGVATWLRESLRDVAFAFSLLRFRGWLLAGGSATAAAILIGIPTDIVPNDWFTRMTPIRPQDYVIWATTALLAGLVVGTFALRGDRRQGEACAMSGGLLSFFAVGCAVCNKLVVLLLGTTGALTFFAPLQLYIGLASIAALAWALLLRARLVAGSSARRDTDAGSVHALS